MTSSIITHSEVKSHSDDEYGESEVLIANRHLEICSDMGEVYPLDRVSSDWFSGVLLTALE